MNQNLDQQIILDSNLAGEVFTKIYLLLDGIRGISWNMTKETMSDDQQENAERILAYTHDLHWAFSDLTLLRSAIGDLSPSPPDQTTTVLDEILEKEGRRGFENTDIGKQLIRDCPDLLQLTLCYREMFNVTLMIKRLLNLLNLLQEQGSLITFQSSTELGEKFNSIRLQIDCKNENLLQIRKNLVFNIALPILDRGNWNQYISGFEFAITKLILGNLGGDFVSEKEGEHLKMILEIPSLKEGKPDLFTALFPKDFPPDPKSSG